MNNIIFIGKMGYGISLFKSRHYFNSLLRLVIIFYLSCWTVDSFAYAIPVGDYACEFTDYSDEVSITYRGDKSISHIEVPEKILIRYRPYDGPYYTEKEFTVVSVVLGECPNLQSVVLPQSLKSLGLYCFKNCSLIESVSIPNNVTEIGPAAFSGCTSLASLNIPNSVTEIGYNAFQNCSSLRTITIPNSVTSIGRAAFLNCTSLSNIHLSNVLTSINDNTFQGCTSLNEILIPNMVTAIGKDAFSGCTSLREISIPNQVTSIGTYAFSGCTSLESIVIHSHLNCISTGMLSGCTSLTSIVFPSNNPFFIGTKAFYGCTSLSSITIPNNATEIGSSAFQGCNNLKTASIGVGEGNMVIKPYAFVGTGLEELIIGNSVSDIQDYAFAEIKTLSSIQFGNGLKNIGLRAFQFCSTLESLVIPNNVETIGDYAFCKCDSLKSLQLGAKVIGQYAFWNCKSIAILSIDDGVEEIGGSAFYPCYALQELVIPSSVKTIRGSAFSGCYSLNKLSFEDGIEVIGDNAFFGNIIESLVLPNSLQTIGNGAFHNNSNNKNGSLKELTLGRDLRIIGSRAFNSSSLQTLNMSCPNLEKIGQEAFAACGMLESDIELPSTVTEIGWYAFGGCSKVKRLKIASGIIGSEAFGGCGMLEVLTLGDNVTAIQNSAFSGCNKLEQLNLGKKVESIGANAFYGCYQLSRIVIPESTTSIGGFAFYGCMNLSELELGKNVNTINRSTFYNCKSLSQLTIPESVTDIYEEAFRNCNSLESLVIPFNVKTIGASAFSGCNNMKSLSIPESITEISQYLFDGCNNLQSLEIPKSVVKINKCAFNGCSSLESLTISNGVQEIGNYAFNWCAKLQNLVIPHSVTTIGEYSFSYCESLESLELGNHIREIPSNAFKNCYKLVSLNLSKDLEILGVGAFAGCNSLDSLELGSNVKEIRDYAFTSCTSLKSLSLPDHVTVLGNYAFSSCKNLTNLNIPSSITSIGNYAFSECGNLLDLNLGTNVQNIGNCAFWGCTILKSLAIPNSVKSIGQSAFENCDSLLTLSLGSSLTEIGDRAFWGCKSLSIINCKTPQPVDIYKSVFTYTEFVSGYGKKWIFNNNATLYVPEAATELYQEHDVWKLFLLKPQMKMVAYKETSDGESSQSRKRSASSEGHIAPQNGQEVEGVTADGASKLFVYFDKEIENVYNPEWIFKINNEEVDSNDPRIGSCGDFKMTEDGKWGFVYTAPEDYLCDGNEYTLTIEVKVYNNESNASVTGNVPPIRIMRPGVLLIHGFTDDNSCFRELYHSLLAVGKYYDYQIINVDYKSSNTASFDDNTHVHKVVGSNIKDLKDQLFKNGIVSSKYDLVGHSMGGILSRKYAQEIAANSVNRIITLNTPHHGSPFGNTLFYILQTLKDKFTKMASEISEKEYKETFQATVELLSFPFYAFYLTKDVMDLDPSALPIAVMDLAPNSEAINRLYEEPKDPGAKEIPVHAVCSYMTNEIEREEKVNRTIEGTGNFLSFYFDVEEIIKIKEDHWWSLTKKIFDTKIFADKHDGVVPLKSQRGGLGDKNVTIEDAPYKGVRGKSSLAYHSKTNHWSKTIADILDLLHLPKHHEKFIKNGFKAPQTSGAGGGGRVRMRSSKDIEYQEANESSFIKLNVEKDENERTAIIHIDQSDDIICNVVFAFVGDGEVIIANDSTDFCFEIPETYNGELKIYALGRTNYNALVVDVTSTEFTNSAVLNKLFFEDNSPVNLNVGEQIDRKVMGWWSNGEDTYLKPEYTTSVDGLLEYDGSTIKAIADGECMLKVSYLGLSDSIRVNIIAPVTELTLSPTSVTLEGGEAVQLEATVNQDATNRELLWTSANGDIAIVNSKGLVRGRSKGTTTITVTSAGDPSYKKECAVTVTSDFEGLMLPDVAFEFYYNAENYDEATTSIPNHEKANLQNASLKLSKNIPTYEAGKYLHIEKRCEGYIDKWNKGATESGNHFYRTGGDCMTIVAKVAPQLNNPAAALIANCSNLSYNYRNYIWQIGTGSLYTSGYDQNYILPITSEDPQIFAIRVDGKKNTILLQNLTTGEQRLMNGVNWGENSSNVFKIFYQPSGCFKGDFYWMYYSFELLSDDELNVFKDRVLKGDANGDGVVDIADALCIVNYLMGNSSADFNEAAADVNNDGVVDIADAVHIVNFVVGNIPVLAPRQGMTLPESK